ncbi:MAG: hypothetical protein J2P46_19925 [Zavarzinella sp.]|nr:hypothetical protein [Zavarzinella sp.]
MSTNDPKKPADSNPGGLPKAKNEEGDSLSEFDLSHEGLVEFGELPPSEEASRVALAQLPEPPSGQSLTTWTEVIRQQRAAQAEAAPDQPVTVDAPSDKDLLTRLGDADARESPSSTSGFRRTADTDELGSGELPVYSPPPAGMEGSAVDLGRALAGRAAGGSEVRFDILYPPSDAGGAIPLPARLPPLSSTSFQQAVAVPVPAGTYPPDEAIPFATPVGPGESGVGFLPDGSSRVDDSRASILDVLLSESRYENPPEVTPAVKPKRPTMPNAGAAGPAHTVATQPGGLEHPPASEPLELTGPESALSVDESVDLLTPVGPPGLTESGSLEMPEGASEEIQRRLPPKESSAVDLGTPSSADSVFDLDADGGSLVRTGSDAAIDLALAPLEDESNSKLKGAVETKRRPGLKAPAKAPPGQPVVTPARIQSLEPRGGGRFLAIGGALGLLIGAGGVLGAYFGGVLPGHGDKPAAAVAPPDNSAELARLRQEAADARNEAVAAKTNADQATATVASVRKALTDAGAPNPDRPADAIKALASRKPTDDSRIQEMTAEANKQRDAAALARQQADAAKKSLAEAEKAAGAARTELADARKAADAAKADLAKATKTADDRLADVRAAAAAKEKEAQAKLAELA